jgi:hypothetical protein
MDRCCLQGALGDALHAISCAAGYNLRWLMRAIARLDIRPIFLRLLQAALSQQPAIGVPHGSLARSWINRMKDWLINGWGKKSILAHTVQGTFWKLNFAGATIYSRESSNTVDIEGKRIDLATGFFPSIELSILIN